MWKLPKRLQVPPQWGEEFDLLPFDDAMPRLWELVTSVDEAHMPAFLSFCCWVATACCCANKGTDISILAVEATRLRKTPRVKAMALQLWNQLQEGEKKVATTEEGQKKKPSKTALLAAALQTASTKRKKRPTKGQRAACDTAETAEASKDGDRGWTKRTEQWRQQWQ